VVFGLPCIQFEMDALDLAGARTLLTRLVFEVQENLLMKYAV